MCSSRILIYLKLRLFTSLLSYIKDLIYDGYSCIQVITQLHDRLLERADISDSKKAIIFEKIAEIDNNLMEGADEYLQLLNMLTILMQQMK